MYYYNSKRFKGEKIIVLYIYILLLKIPFGGTLSISHLRLDICYSKALKKKFARMQDYKFSMEAPCYLFIYFFLTPSIKSPAELRRQSQTANSPFLSLPALLLSC